MKVLELFAGARCFGVEAQKLGHEVFSVDWTDYPGINLCMDIGYMQISDIPFVPDYMHLSPDCATYSIAGIRFHRINSITPISEYAKKCDEVNQHCISLIEQLLILNPNMVFTIENPRGMLRKMPFMKQFKRHTVWYCQYGDERAKPTDIWTNSKTWKPKVECHNYKYDESGNIINKHCHHDSARRGGKTGTQGRKNSHERSKIPSELCIEILKSIELTEEVFTGKLF
jgi:hypothetical protein